jgi:hypothetical protein
MDKLQITITLSPEAAPDLLAYLRQIPGARERAFVFRLLAQHGLRALGGAGPVGLLPAPENTPARTPLPAGGAVPTDSDVNIREHSLETMSPVTPVPTNPTIAAPQAVSSVDTTDAFAIRDVGALNDAMARFG